MSAATEALCNHPVFRFFRVISDIPRPSKHEEQISQFLFRWARERGLEAEQDEKLNILIRKPATPGYEGAPGIMLQAHMDMVCEKAPEAEHDFMKDPIHWELDGDILSTGRRTTLGADDGIGVAMAMAVLDDDTLSHPALEVLFTTAEEDDFSGAEHFDVSKMTATRLINLDHANEKQILCGSCGGISAELTVPIASGPVPEGWSAFELAVDGLHGGHSGEDIHRGHGNATTLLARVLLALSQSGEMKLGPVKGGTFRLAIPRGGQSGGVYPPGAGAGAHRPGGSAAGDDAPGAVGHRGQDHRSGQAHPEAGVVQSARPLFGRPAAGTRRHLSDERDAGGPGGYLGQHGRVLSGSERAAPGL